MCIRDRLASSLAGGAIVRFVGGIADSLDFGSAARTRLLVFSVHRHPWTECRYLLGKFCAGILMQDSDPLGQLCFRNRKEPLNLFMSELLSQLNRGELRLKKDLVGVGVSNAC